MSDKYILLEDIEDLGRAGDLVNVKTGYARNYLIPKKLALKASKGAMRQFEAKREKIEAKRQAEIAAKQELANKIQKMEISLAVNVGEDEKMYGSVTTHNIADEITKQGVEVDHTQVIIADNIKELGEYDVKIKLHTEVIPEIKVAVVKA